MAGMVRSFAIRSAQGCFLFYTMKKPYFLTKVFFNTLFSQDLL